MPIRSYIHTFVFSCECDICICMRTQTYIYIHTHIHTYEHTHICTLTQIFIIQFCRVLYCIRECTVRYTLRRRYHYTTTTTHMRCCYGRRSRAYINSYTALLFSFKSTLLLKNSLLVLSFYIFCVLDAAENKDAAAAGMRENKVLLCI